MNRETTDWQGIVTAPQWLRDWERENMLRNGDSMQLTLSPDYEWYCLAQGGDGRIYWRAQPYPLCPSEAPNDES